MDEANKTDDVEQIKKKMDALMKAMEPISSRIYQEASAEQAHAGETGGKQTKEGTDEDVVDADYTIVDDEEN